MPMPDYAAVMALLKKGRLWFYPIAWLRWINPASNKLHPATTKHMSPVSKDFAETPFMRHSLVAVAGLPRRCWRRTFLQ